MKRRFFLITSILASLAALWPWRKKRIVFGFDPAHGKDATLVAWLVHPQGDGWNWVEPYTPEQLRNAKPGIWPPSG